MFDRSKISTRVIDDQYVGDISTIHTGPVVNIPNNCTIVGNFKTTNKYLIKIKV